MGHVAKPIRYFVEGECEESLINAFKVGNRNALVAGKVTVFNVVNERLKPSHLFSLKKGTIVILVYDTDVPNVSMLNENIELLDRYGCSEIHHIQSIMTFEDEIVFSSNIKDVRSCFGTKTAEEFKHHFCCHKNLCTKLSDIGFEPSKIWSRVNKSKPFGTFSKQESLNFLHKNNNKK